MIGVNISMGNKGMDSPILYTAEICVKLHDVVNCNANRAVINICHLLPIIEVGWGLISQDGNYYSVQVEIRL